MYETQWKVLSYYVIIIKTESEIKHKFTRSNISKVLNILGNQKICKSKDKHLKF